VQKGQSKSLRALDNDLLLVIKRIMEQGGHGFHATPLLQRPGISNENCSLLPAHSPLKGGSSSRTSACYSLKFEALYFAILFGHEHSARIYDDPVTFDFQQFQFAQKNLFVDDAPSRDTEGRLARLRA
jgi:hypothetical protein